MYANLCDIPVHAVNKGISGVPFDLYHLLTKPVALSIFPSLISESILYIYLYIEEYVMFKYPYKERIVHVNEHHHPNT